MLAKMGKSLASKVIVKCVNGHVIMIILVVWTQALPMTTAELMVRQVYLGRAEIAVEICNLAYLPARANNSF